MGHRRVQAFLLDIIILILALAPTTLVVPAHTRLVEPVDAQVCLLDITIQTQPPIHTTLVVPVHTRLVVHRFALAYPQDTTMAIQLLRRTIRVMLVHTQLVVRQLAHRVVLVHTLDRRHPHVQFVLRVHIQAQQPVCVSIVVLGHGQPLDRHRVVLVDLELTRVPKLLAVVYVVEVPFQVPELLFVIRVALVHGLLLVRQDAQAAMQVRGRPL